MWRLFGLFQQFINQQQMRRMRRKPALPVGERGGKRGPMTRPGAGHFEQGEPAGSVRGIRLEGSFERFGMRAVQGLPDGIGQAGSTLGGQGIALGQCEIDCRRVGVPGAKLRGAERAEVQAARVSIEVFGAARGQCAQRLGGVVCLQRLLPP